MTRYCKFFVRIRSSSPSRYRAPDGTYEIEVRRQRTRKAMMQSIILASRESIPFIDGHDVVRFDVYDEHGAHVASPEPSELTDRPGEYTILRKLALCDIILEPVDSLLLAPC